MSRLCLSAALAFALLAQVLGVTAAHAQRTEPAESDNIVITAQTEEAIQNFVGQIAVAGRSENQLARWDRTICPSIVGLRGSYAQLVVDQIARRAFDVGLGVGKPTCQPNILIIVSTSPDAVARGLFDHYKRRLGYYGAKTLGRNALRTFVDSTAAVRWWHVNITASPDGRKPDTNGSPVFGLGGQAPSVNLGAPSLIKRAMRQDLAMAFIIVDGRRLQGMNLSSLADYLAMAALAQIDPNADTSGYPSILNLFSPPAVGAPPAALTEWDIAYLHGLYEATRESASAKRQQNEIARSMTKDLASPD